MSDGIFPVPKGQEERIIALEGARMVFAGDEKTAVLVLRDGIVHLLELVREGRVVTSLVLGEPVGRTAIPATLEHSGNGHIFVGSVVGESVLLKAAVVEEEVEEQALSTQVDELDMEMDDEDEGAFFSLIHSSDMVYSIIFTSAIYGISKPPAAVNGVATKNTTTKIVTSINISLCDTIPAYGPISDMTFGIAKNGVSNIWPFI